MKIFTVTDWNVWDAFKEWALACVRLAWRHVDTCEEFIDNIMIGDCIQGFDTWTCKNFLWENVWNVYNRTFWDHNVTHEHFAGQWDTRDTGESQTSNRMNRRLLVTSAFRGSYEQNMYTNNDSQYWIVPIIILGIVVGLIILFVIYKIIACCCTACAEARAHRAYLQSQQANQQALQTQAQQMLAAAAQINAPNSGPPLANTVIPSDSVIPLDQGKSP